MPSRTGTGRRIITARAQINAIKRFFLLSMTVAEDYPAFNGVQGKGTAANIVIIEDSA